MANFIKEFKEFIMRGNVLDMAVGIIIGGAFTAIVTSLVDDILNPIIALFGSEDLATLGYAIPGTEAVIGWGAFISAIINFLIVALVIFAIIKAVNKAQNLANKEEEEAAEEAPAAPTEAELLSEIVDLLKKEKTE